MLWDQIEELLRDGWHFDNFGNGSASSEKYVYICFYSPEKELFISLRFSSENSWNVKKITRIERRATEHAKFPELLVGPDISRQFIQFALDYRNRGLWKVSNWVGFDLQSQVSLSLASAQSDIRFGHNMCFNYFKKKESESREAFKEIQFPGALAEVSSIVSEYTIYTFYDFLADEFETLERYVFKGRVIS